MIEIAAAIILPKLHELNDNKIIKIKDKYPALRTRKRRVETFWDSLNGDQKFQIGSVALYYSKITPNYPWACQENKLFNDLTKSQQKIVTFIFSKRNDNWYMFNLNGLLGLK